mmetsp:Transcript_28995/g.74537  ORF Transcript_28995/g.74537 Transcript_28995/m.74537 type:complete len:311 (+) Transcript_28995:668-1600(+)
MDPDLIDAPWHVHPLHALLDSQRRRSPGQLIPHRHTHARDGAAQAPPVGASPQAPRRAPSLLSRCRSGRTDASCAVCDRRLRLWRRRRQLDASWQPGVRTAASAATAAAAAARLAQSTLGIGNCLGHGHFGRGWRRWRWWRRRGRGGRRRRRRRRGRCGSRWRRRGGGRRGAGTPRQERGGGGLCRARAHAHARARRRATCLHPISEAPIKPPCSSRDRRRAGGRSALGGGGGGERASGGARCGAWRRRGLRRSACSLAARLKVEVRRRRGAARHTGRRPGAWRSRVAHHCRLEVWRETSLGAEGSVARR